jgi:DNA-binding MarR family transcriptional regulator
VSHRDSLELFSQSLQAVHRYLRRNGDTGRDGITRVQWLILWDLWRHEKRTIGELAEKLDVRPSTMSQMIDRLELAGLVYRCQDVHDARTRIVQLTDSGKERIQRLKDMRTQLLAEPFQQLDEDEQATLVELMAKLASFLPKRGD